MCPEWCRDTGVDDKESLLQLVDTARYLSTPVLLARVILLTREDE